MSCVSLTKNGAVCRNQAKYMYAGNRYCGVHCKDSDREFIDDITPIYGNVIVSKLLMRRKAPYAFNYMSVFPNNRHQNRKDGFGCCSLSPMRLGPIKHVMPNLPPALNLENYHQHAKFWEFEFENGVVSDEYLQKRIQAYNDPIPHRHKYDKAYLKEHNQKLTPVCSIYYDKYGNERRYTYIECRYFYCHYYELLAKQTEDYTKLLNMLEDGYKLNIIGYDGRPVIDIQDHYLDESKPFGHELALYCLLTLEPEEYPWNIYIKNNPDKYVNMF